MKRLTLLPYLQHWDGARLQLRLLLAPQGSPLAPLLPGQPSFAQASLQLDLRIVAGLQSLPTLATPHTSLLVPSPAPAQAQSLCNALVQSLPINPDLPPFDPRSAGARFLKFAPAPYRAAAGISAGASPYIVTDERYRCAMQSPVPSGTPLKSKEPELGWGHVMALSLRQPLLAESLGLLRVLQIEPPAGLLAEGGWIYVSLAPGSDAAALATTPGALGLYAARIPPLDAARNLFTSVLFPVADAVPAADYDALFQEVIDYDDGFAKIVYSAQQEYADHLQEDNDGSRPAVDNGIRLGWDDEQVALWMNRPVDPALAAQDAPTGISGYRIDARLAGAVEWQSLVQGETSLLLDGIDLGTHSGEFQVDIAPSRIMGDTSGTFWMPSYFATWKGPALVGHDTLGLALLGESGDSIITGTAPALALRYGQEYEFRVRLVDHTGGGPGLADAAANPAPQPVATQPFRRWLRPQPLRLLTPLPIVADPDNAPQLVKVKRPLLGYPAYGYAGGNVQELLADMPAAKAEKRNVGLPDPDVTAVEIRVDVADPAAPRGLRRLYQTTRFFPDVATQSLQLDFDWQDHADVTALSAPAQGPLPLPTARDLRISLLPLGHAEENYFGAEDARRGPATQMSLRRESADETALWLPASPADQLRAIYLQPDPAVDTAVAFAQKAAGLALAAPGNALGRLAAALDLQHDGNSLRGRDGQRVWFGCSPALRQVTDPAGASLSFSAVSDLAEIWLVALRLQLRRDWSWDGLDHLRIERDGKAVGRLDPRRGVGTEARAGAPHTHSDIVYIDALDPKPAKGQFPRERELHYRIVPVLRKTPQQADAPLEISVRLPVTTPPAQVPRLASAGIALSPYQRSSDYSRTEPRRRLLWLEFAEPPADPHDGIFARVLASAPDPALLRTGIDGPELAEPPLPLDPEPLRVIVPGQADDGAGLGAMQQLLPTDSPRHFLLPLPPGISEDSARLFGFYTYELRVGHAVDWSTAQARYGSALRVTGVQHPAPTLSVQVQRRRSGIEVTAPFANPLRHGRSVRPVPPVTQLWVLLYAQVVQADNQDRRNILIDTRAAPYGLNSWDYGSGKLRTADAGTATWSNSEVSEMCTLLGLSRESRLSCLVVETLPGDEPVPDPLVHALGYERFLRTSPLTAVPDMCV
jgi:hypothetical protein